ncbi:MULTISPECIES: hypothetical protein [unclassified Pseudomonas]|uniref:Uncharacterized protein n=1 Tax=Pseudomonas sp. MYb327 TaxID=2745230 RepID=A0AAU8E890_9PSED
MNVLKVAASDAVRQRFHTSRPLIALDQIDFTDIAVAVLTVRALILTPFKEQRFLRLKRFMCASSKACPLPGDWPYAARSRVNI